ncbi:MAG: large subunit ribosomal protein L9 [Gammaproteobacteria bacterium]|nr:MAG: large subunit ribosomal protein L9 [Gammaproteobacteria bacterium]TND07131.1 MAG: large subunit ribosomal protein L9 [Gammaproteobacteria bacterium]
MDIILLEQITNLGELGDLVKVKQGYGRNYLIPLGKAVAATPDNKAKFEARRAELQKTAAERLASAKARFDLLNNRTVLIRARAGDGGKLFGSVGTVDIAESLSAQGSAVEKREILMPDGPIRETGAFEIALSLHPDVTATITISVEAEA